VLLPVAGLLGDEKSPQADSLSVRLQLPKSVFLVGEEIPLDIYLVNQTDRTLQIPQAWSRKWHLRIECRDSNGRLVPPSAIISERLQYPEPTRLHLPHDSIFTTADPACVYGRSLTKGAFFPGQAVGSYSIVATYDRSQVSNELPYVVVEPTGLEKVVFDELLSICDQYDAQSIVAVAPKLEEILRANPQSVYAPMILRLLSGTFQSIKITELDKVIGYAKWTVASYPNSLEAIDALFDILNYVPPDLALSYFTETENSKSGTRAGLQASALRIYTQNQLKKPNERK
jgi:hypothetical protein